MNFSELDNKSIEELADQFMNSTECTDLSSQVDLINKKFSELFPLRQAHIMSGEGTKVELFIRKLVILKRQRENKLD